MPDHPDHPYRMRDLVRLTGMSAPTIHFYAASGLLPPPRKLGRTQARYPAATVEQIRWIRALQQELGLSLRAIRDVLARDGRLPVAEVRTRLLLGQLLPVSAPATASAEGKLSADEVARLRARGIEPDRRLEELVLALRRAGFDAEHGFSIAVIADYRDAVQRLIHTELRHMLGPTLDRLGPEETAALLVRGLPLVDELLALFHHRAFLEEFAAWRALVRDRQQAYDASA